MCDADEYVDPYEYTALGLRWRYLFCLRAELAHVKCSSSEEPIDAADRHDSTSLARIINQTAETPYKYMQV